MAYSTKYGSSGNRSEYFGVYDSDNHLVGSAYTIDDGENWFIRGLFPETSRSFTSSQTAIKQAISLYEKAREARSFAIF
jgi:hypothetical protein